MEKNLKNIRHQFKEQGVFYTTDKLANKLKSLIDVPFNDVYDPTCGQGNLLNIFADDVKKYGQELDPEEAQKAREQGIEVYTGDVLIDDGFKDRKFDLIVANPPFSIQWAPNKDDPRFQQCPFLAPKSKADWAFLLHMIYHLNDGGQCITLAFPGTTYRGNAEGKIRRWFIEQNYIDKVIANKDNAFEDTAIATLIYVLKKKRDTTNITFINEDGIEKAATLKEIEDNNYSLSVGHYIDIEDENEKEKIDPIELQHLKHNQIITTLQQEYELDKLIEEIEDKHYDYSIFLNNLSDITQKYINDFSKYAVDYSNKWEVKEDKNARLLS